MKTENAFSSESLKKQAAVEAFVQGKGQVSHNVKNPPDKDDKQISNKYECGTGQKSHRKGNQIKQFSYEKFLNCII